MADERVKERFDMLRSGAVPIAPRLADERPELADFVIPAAQEEQLAMLPGWQEQADDFQDAPEQDLGRGDSAKRPGVTDVAEVPAMQPTDTTAVQRRLQKAQDVEQPTTLSMDSPQRTRRAQVSKKTAPQKSRGPPKGGTTQRATKSSTAAAQSVALEGGSSAAEPRDGRATEPRVAAPLRHLQGAGDIEQLSGMDLNGEGHVTRSEAGLHRKRKGNTKVVQQDVQPRPRKLKRGTQAREAAATQRVPSPAGPVQAHRRVGNAAAHNADQVPRKKGRRQRTEWSPEEEQQLAQGLIRFGRHWAVILTNFDFDSKRTAVDLKDKWRTIERKFPR